MEFQLEGEDYIELKDLLKVSGLCETGGQAKIAISESKVTVDGKTEIRKGCKIRSGQVVSYEGKSIRVVA